MEYYEVICLKLTATNLGLNLFCRVNPLTA